MYVPLLKSYKKVMEGWLDEDINYDLILQIIVESNFCISKMIIPH